MKSSTIILLLAAVLFLGALTAYNFSLKASYKTGSYKARFRDYTFTPLKNINMLDLKSSNLMFVRVEHGTQEGVWVSNRQKEQLSIVRQGNLLSLDFRNKDARQLSSYRYDQIVVVVNRLRQLHAGNHVFSDKQSKEFGGTLELIGINADSLDLLLEGTIDTRLGSSRLGMLKVSLGAEGTPAGLTMVEKNHIDTAYFNVKGQSSLHLSDALIAVPHYQLSRDCSVQMSGALLQQSSK